MRLQSFARASCLAVIVTSLALRGSSADATDQTTDHKQAAADALAGVLKGRAAMRQARLAYDAKDYGTFLDATVKAAEPLPGNPEVTYNLACAYSLMGQPAAAVTVLQRLADLGVDFHIDEDPDVSRLLAVADLHAVNAALVALRVPFGLAAEAFGLDEPDFLPAGIAYDPRTRAFFLGSVRRRTITRIDAQGKTALLPAKSETPLDSPLGMVCDGPRRRLWVCAAAVPEMAGYQSETGQRTALLAIDIDRGVVEKRLEAARDGLLHCFTDVTVAKDGTVYLSDAKGGVIYRLKPEASTLEMVVRPGPLTSPRGLALSADETLLFVADYGIGLFVFDIGTATLAPVWPPAGSTLAGIDGLVRAGRRLFAIRNGFRPHAVLAVELSADGKKALQVETLLRNDPVFDQPTRGVVVNNNLYFVANSQWPLFSARAAGKPTGQPKPPIVLKLALDR